MFDASPDIVPGVLLHAVQHHRKDIQNEQWVAAEWRIYVHGDYNIAVRYDDGSPEPIIKDKSGTIPKFRFSRLRRAMENVHPEQIEASAVHDGDTWQFWAGSDSGDVLFVISEPISIDNCQELQKLVALLPDWQ